MGIIGNIGGGGGDLASLESTVQGTGSYTIPAGKKAEVAAFCSINTRAYLATNDSSGYDSSGSDGTTSTSGFRTDGAMTANSSSGNVSNRFFLVAGDSITVSSNTTHRQASTYNSNIFLLASYHDHHASFNVNGTTALKATSSGYAYGITNGASGTYRYAGVFATANIGWNAAIYGV